MSGKVTPNQGLEGSAQQRARCWVPFASLLGAPSAPAYYVDRILNGVKPAELPIEQLSELKLAVNLRTAKAMDIVIPESILVRADKVIR